MILRDLLKKRNTPGTTDRGDSWSSLARIKAALTSPPFVCDLSRAMAGKVLTARRQNSSEKSSGMGRYHYHGAIFSPSGFEAGSHPSRPFIGRTMSHVHSAYISSQACSSAHTGHTDTVHKYSRHTVQYLETNCCETS